MTELGSLFLILLLFLAALGNLSAVSGQVAMTLLEGVCVLLLLSCLRQAKRGDAAWQPVPGLLPLALLTGFLSFQVLPLPPFLLRLLSPKAWDLYAETVWLARPASWMPLSLTPEAAWTGLFRFITCAAVYVVSTQVLATRERMKKNLPPFALCAAGAALLGMAFFGGRGGGFAGWVNPFPAHFAVLMAMTLPVVVAQYLVSRPQVSYLSFRQKTVRFLRQPGAYPHLLQGASFLLALFFILLSGAWSGLLGGMGGLLFFLLLLLTRSRGRKETVWSLLILPLLLLTATALLEEGGLVGRAGPASGHVAPASRSLSQGDLGIVRDFPFWGTGAGSFTEVSRRYRSERGVGSDEGGGGNTYLQSLVEGGVAGVSLFAWFLFVVLRRTLSAWRRRHSRTAVYLYLGALSGMFAILAAGWVEGGLQGSAVGLGFFFCAGLGVAAATSSSRPEERAESAPPLSSLLLSIWMFPLLLALLFHAGLAAASLWGRSGGAVDVASVGMEGPAVSSPGAAVASILAPFDAEYRYALADNALGRGDVPEALREFVAALRLRPLRAEYLQRLGLVFDNLGQDERAERLLRSGVASDSSNPQRNKILAYWLLSKGRGEEALEPVRRALYWEPEKTWDFLGMMALHGLSDEAMRRAMPERSLSLLAYGDYLMDAGKETAAEASFMAAIRAAMTEPRPSALPFQRVADMYARRGENEAALETALAGIEVLPRNARLRFLAATLYERLGVTYRAIEEYRGVLALEPDNGDARERLRELGVSM